MFAKALKRSPARSAFCCFYPQRMAALAFVTSHTAHLLQALQRMLRSAALVDHVKLLALEFHAMATTPPTKAAASKLDDYSVSIVRRSAQLPCVSLIFAR